VYRRKHGGELPGRESKSEPSLDRQGEVAAAVAHNEYERARRRGAGWFSSFRRAAGTWWRHHPAHMGVEIVTPLLSAYAAKRPVVYLGAAAVLGAVIVLTRPWRLISLTGLVVALAKSSQLSSMVMSAVSAANFDGDYDGHSPPYR